MKKALRYLYYVLVITSITGCCDRRCGVRAQKAQEPINLQYKVEKMKEQAGDRGLK